LQMAKKSIRKDDPVITLSELSAMLKDEHGDPTIQTHDAENKQHIPLEKLIRVSAKYAGDLTRAGFKTPVAFFYNVANGFHNLPSYGFWSTEVRRRDEITGLGSGVRTAGKEFVFGFYDALSGLVLQPYRGAKQEGAKGFGKGLLRASRGLVCNIGAATFGLPGYTLKGVEKELSKRNLTEIKAEMYLIRLRQSIEEYQDASESERQEAVTRWKKLHP